MSNRQMVLLSVLAAAMFAATVALTPRYPPFPQMPADGSAPPLPAPVTLNLWRQYVSPNLSRR